MKSRIMLKGIMVLMLCLMVGSCTMTKRKHRRGFYVERFKNYSIAKDENDYLIDVDKKEDELKKESVCVQEPDRIANEKTDYEILPQKLHSEKRDFEVKRTEKNRLSKDDGAKSLAVGNETESSFFKKEIKKNKLTKSIKENKSKEIIDNIGEREIWAYIGLVFTMVMLFDPFVLGILAVIYNIKGLKSRKKRMAIVCLIISGLLLSLTILSFVTSSYFTIYGLSFFF